MKYKLSDLVSIIGGGTPKTSKTEYWNGDIPWLSVKDFNNDFRYVYKTEKRITQLGLENSSTKILNKGDMIISARGTVGEIASIPYPMTFNQSCYGLRAKENMITSDFLYYLIKYNISILKNQTHGSVFDTITKSTFDEIWVDIPGIMMQDKIATILSIIDKKIELNYEINKNLIQQTQELFKAWFVTFEAFGGEMPSSWKSVKLGDIASIKTNSFSPAKNPTVMLEHYSIPAFDEQKYPIFELASNVKSNKYILTDNSVMISKLNPNIKRVWRPMCISEFVVSSTEFIIFEANDPTYKDFVFSVIDSAAFSDWMCAHTTGSTNSRQRTTPSTTLEFKIALPNQEIIYDFCQIVTPMYDMITQNICENQKLATFRDSLLPKLMSGELDVSDIEL
jgi:type I restriction enzyme S subunit